MGNGPMNQRTYKMTTKLIIYSASEEKKKKNEINLFLHSILNSCLLCEPK